MFRYLEKALSECVCVVYVCLCAHTRGYPGRFAVHHTRLLIVPTHSSVYVVCFVYVCPYYCSVKVDVSAELS